ncbi:putative C6 transcription factor [Aspergillus foveolatus]|uniref:putative C6 transcription factor n=1 Tax=Aspergillus foveolatus TaxID=210207 RepID=UPI003CCCDA5F
MASVATANATHEDQQPLDLEGRSATADQDDGVDGMGAVPLKDGGEKEEYFGMSSNVVFLRFIMETMKQENPQIAPPTSTMAAPPDLGQTGNGSIDEFDERRAATTSARRGRRPTTRSLFTLPPQREGDALLRLYFTTVNLMIPCVHEDSFRDTYAKMQRNGLGSTGRPWLSILSVIFAIATNVAAAISPTNERATKSNMYFEQALELVKWDMLGRPSLEIVQLFLLMETYLEGTTSSSMTWTVHGLAVKGAYQLGLHIRDFRNASAIDKEVRRRLWYWCIVNDRLLSTRYGRPPLIPLSHVRLEPSVHIPFSNVSSATTASSLGFFDAIMTLTHIMGDALEQLYDQNLALQSSLPTSKVLDRIFGLCWKLAEWQDALPADLKIIDPGKEMLEDVPLTVGTARFRVLLSLRYLGTRVLIMRPVLNQFLVMGQDVTSSNEHQSDWLRDSGATLLAGLVQTCRNVFRISKTILVGSQSNQNLLGAWWFSCFYTFNASLAVIDVLIVQTVPISAPQLRTNSAFSTAELRGLLDTAMEVLTGLDQGNKTLMKCRDTLARLLRCIDLNSNADPTPDTFTPESLSLFSSGTWTGQLMDPCLFSSEASLGLAIGAYDNGYDSHIPEMAESWDMGRI